VRGDGSVTFLPRGRGFFVTVPSTGSDGAELTCETSSRDGVLPRGRGHSLPPRAEVSPSERAGRAQSFEAGIGQTRPCSFSQPQSEYKCRCGVDPVTVSGGP